VCFVAPNAYSALSEREDVAHAGGAERQQVLLAEELVRRGHRVSFVVLDHGQPDGEENRGIRAFKCYGVEGGIRGLRFFHPRLTGLWNAMARADSDVYYQRGAGSETGLVAHWCRRWARGFIFAVANETTCMHVSPFLTKRSDRFLFRYGLRRADAVIAQSPYVANFKSLDKGPSDFDYRHVFVASYVWQLPALSRSNPFVRAAGGGWQLSGIWSAQSGIPVSISAGLDRSQTGIGFDKGQLVALNAYGTGACQNRAPCVDKLDPSAFALPALGTYGNLSKGALRGPGLFNTDFGVSKAFTIREGFTASFRAEFFNFFNRSNLNGPVSTVSAGGFGAILSARDPLIGQLALKLNF